MSEPLINISRKQALLFAFFLVLYEFFTYIANDMIMPGMIQVVKSFNAPESTVATSLTIYILGGASLQLILGPTSDAYGRRPVMLFGAMLFCCFTFLIATSQSIEQFLTARFFQGMGLCFISVIGYATIQELFDEMDAIRLIAIMANAAILAPLLGPLLGAAVIHYTSWRIIFVMIGFSALYALWGLWRYMPEPIGQTTKNGDIIPKVSFAPRYIINNYKDLLTNKIFCFSTVAVGLVGIPCLAWIALAPIIMIVEAKLTVIQYGLWQLPIFGATILGNWMLHHLTYKYSMKTIMRVGCIILTVGTSLMAVLPYFYGNHFLYLLPGIIVYFFSLSILNAPLNRFCLYITNVSKGTASAIISLNVMIIAAVGIEIANKLYEHHSNLHFGLYSVAVTVLFLLFISLAFWCDKKSTNIQ
jgi:MFS transporter, DHA1 family, multidrug/chloramphenicol efflux transport protein